jgi:predicted  nucleic acid-binding Zn-ribbon protein
MIEVGMIICTECKHKYDSLMNVKCPECGTSIYNIYNYNTKEWNRFDEVEKQDEY